MPPPRSFSPALEPAGPPPPRGDRPATADAQSPRRGHAPGKLAGLGLGILLLAVGGATVLAIVAGNPILAVLPVTLVAGAFALVKLPLRWSASVLLVALLCLEDSGDAAGQWHTPLVFLGDLLNSRIDAVAGVPGLAVSGMEVILAFLFGVWVHRRAGGNAIDVTGQVPSASPIRPIVLLYVAAVCYAEVMGLVSGGSAVPWKVRNLLHPIMLFLLFQAAYRGPRDQALLGRLIVFAACFRAGLVVLVQEVARARTGGELSTGTNHGDSVLFAVAIFLLVVEVLERPTRGRLLRAGVILPILFAGAIHNNRRIVWVTIGMMLVVTYLLSPLKAWARALTKFILVAAPVVALYLAVGWERESKIFAPVRTLRSVMDTRLDGSAYWREVENWNLAMSLRESPVLGIGLGKQYTEHMKNADISSVYKEYREWPHNSILGLLLFLGVLGFTAVWWPAGVTIFLAVRSYRFASEPAHRVAALGCVGAAIACFVLAYADTGAHYTQFKVFFALSLAMAGKLAVVTGAWPGTRPAPGGAPAPGRAGA